VGCGAARARRDTVDREPVHVGRRAAGGSHGDGDRPAEGRPGGRTHERGGERLTQLVPLTLAPLELREAFVPQPCQPSLKTTSPSRMRMNVVPLTTRDSVVLRKNPPIPRIPLQLTGGSIVPSGSPKLTALTPS